VAEPSAAIDRKAILTLRRRVRFQDGRPYDARCRPVAAALEAPFGWPRRFGRLLDARVCWQHCWNQLADGRILDATADQFESRWFGDIVVLAADDPHATAYQPAPPPWTFTLREQEAVIELAAVRLELTAAISLKLSQGFSKLLPALATVVFSALSLTLLSFAFNVKGFEVGVVYAVWSGVGMAFIVTIEIIWKQREQWNGKDIGPIGTMARIGLGLGFVGSVVHGQLATRLAPASLPTRPHRLLRSRAGLALVADSPQPGAFPRHQPGSASRSASHCPWPSTSPGGLRPPSPSKAGQRFSSEASPWCSQHSATTPDARCWPSPTGSSAALTRSPAPSSRPSTIWSTTSPGESVT